MNPYAIAFAVGYYYGRAFPSYLSHEIIVPEQDMGHRSNVGFDDGFKAGQRDFQEVDLPIEAEACHA